MQVALAAVPAAALLLAGKAGLAGHLFWVVFGVMMCRLAVLARVDELLCVLLALAPFQNLLRDFISYSVVAPLFFAALAFYFVKSPKVIQERLRQCLFMAPLLGFAAVFYAVSVILTGDYASNMRFLELAFAVLAVLVIGRNRQALGVALTGVIFSAVAIGVAMLPYVRTSFEERLGMVEIGGIYLGNPIQLGTPLALGVLAATVERGAWLGLRPLGRAVLLAASLGLLALTTSRASWLVVAVGAAATLLLGRGQRLRVVVVMGIGFVATEALLISPYGEGLQKGLERTFSEERSLRRRSTGRSDQWIVAYYAFSQSAGSILHGYGPGLGPKVYAQESEKVQGVEFGVGEERALHSFFMQLAVETGLLGLVPVLAWLLTALVRILGWCRRTGALFPLVCFLGYVVIGGTVSAEDTLSGIFLGIGLLATVKNTGRSSGPVWGRTRDGGIISRRPVYAG